MIYASVTIEYPTDIKAAMGMSEGELRQRFRNTVIGRVRRRMEKVASDAASATQYPPAKQGYRVGQRTEGNSIIVAIGNEAPTFWYTQFYKGKQPPSGKGTPLQEWAFQHGAPAFPVATRLAAWGQRDSGSFARVWEAAVPDLEETTAQAIFDFASRWGNV